MCIRDRWYQRRVHGESFTENLEPMEACCRNIGEYEDIDDLVDVSNDMIVRDSDGSKQRLPHNERVELGYVHPIHPGRENSTSMKKYGTNISNMPRLRIFHLSQEIARKSDRSKRM
eukprot:TRINITY_DN4799_c0_g1_i2.p1 TRINITY_DN4799_c0_g1~~TRINITY_DN4799_c0_g1_i2.p1  ORF type:complete len:136 (+),score=29.94 TRINITY_DN4799_c0_g1_i2:61-408(+)